MSIINSENIYKALIEMTKESSTLVKRKETERKDNLNNNKKKSIHKNLILGCKGKSKKIDNIANKKIERKINKE
jgi:hypothetical protein